MLGGCLYDLRHELRDGQFSAGIAQAGGEEEASIENGLHFAGGFEARDGGFPRNYNAKLPKIP